MTQAAAAIAAVIALTECPECGALAGHGCRGRYGRLMMFSTHIVRRDRAKRYRKMNPAHYANTIAMARELSRGEYLEHMKAKAAQAGSV